MMASASAGWVAAVHLKHLRQTEQCWQLQKTRRSKGGTSEELLHGKVCPRVEAGNRGLSRNVC